MRYVLTSLALILLAVVLVTAFRDKDHDSMASLPTEGSVSAPQRIEASKPRGDSDAPPPERTSLNPTVQIEETSLCRGRVIDDDGKPVARVTLGIWRRGFILASVSTTRDGTFTLTAPELRDENFVKIIDSARCESARMIGPVTYGSEPIVIELQRTHRRRIVVVAADTDEPVTDYAVRMRPKRETDNAVGDPRFAGHHPAGQVAITGLWRGDNYLSILPTDASLAPSAVMTINPITLKGLFRVELTRRRTMTIEVVFDDGTAVVGSTVAVIATRGHRKIVPYGQPFDRRSHPLGPIRSHWTRSAERTSSGLTDEHGKTVVGIPLEEFCIVVRNEMLHAPIVVEHDQIQGDTHRVTLPEPGELIVNVKHAFPKGWHWKINVRGAHSGSSTSFDSVDDGTGPYHLKHLNTGKHAVRLWQIMVPGLGKRTTSETLSVDIRPGERHVVTLDARKLAPARITGHVSIEDRAAEGTVTLYANKYPHKTAMISGIPLVNGSFTVKGFPAGPCLLALDPDPEQGRHFPLWAPQLSVPIKTGDNEVSYRFDERTAVFRIANEKGEPIRQTTFFVGIVGHREERVSDDLGEVVVEHVPNDVRLRLFLFAKGNDHLAEVRSQNIDKRRVIDVTLTAQTLLRTTLRSLPGSKRYR